MLKRIIYLFPLFYSTLAFSQDTVSSANGKLLLLPVRNAWIGTANAAGLATLPVPSLGRTYVGGYFEEGDLKRPQQPSSSRSIRFVSERYQQLQDASLYGKFVFNRAWDQEILMSDVLDPFRRNPYVLGDSLGGDWKKQTYDLEVKASVPLNSARTFFAGAGLQFRAGTGARQNDPRPETYSNELNLSPSVLWKPDASWSIGANGQFDFYKEDISVATSNNEDNHFLYRLAGIGNYYQQIISGGYNRYYKGNTVGGGLQVQWEKPGLQLLLDGGYAYRKEDAEDGSTIPRVFGRFTERQYHASAVLSLLTGTYTHQWTASWKSFDGEGRDMHYGPVTVDKPVNLVNDDVLNTTYYNEAGLHYRWIADAFQDDFKWMLDASAVYSGMDLRYLYPRNRQTIDANEYSLRFSRNHILSDARNFIWSLNMGLRDCFTAFNDYTPFGPQTGIVMDKLLNPDQAWLASDIFKAGISAEYRFPVAKRSQTSLYLRAEGNLWKKMGSGHELTGDTRNFAGLTFGMTY